MNSIELINFLRQEGIKVSAIKLADREYMFPSRKWFFTTFANALHESYKNLGLLQYIEEGMDCDNYAVFAYSYAQILHAKMKRKKGFAIGEFWYNSESLGGLHAIVCAVIRLRGNYYLNFLEPQPIRYQGGTTAPPEAAGLTSKEIKSCSFLRI